MNDAAPHRPLRVAILDDHASIVDGYRFRLGQTAGVNVCGAARFGEDLRPLLAQCSPDVLLLDVAVPTSASNRNPYPILNELACLLEEYPNLSVIVISMHAESGIIKAVMQAGASGYLLKEDVANLERLDQIVIAVAGGDICLSPQALALWQRRRTDGAEVLTERQLQALSLCSAYPNLPIAALAARLNVAPSTMRNLLSNSYLRLNVSTRAAAVAEARQRGLITPADPPPLIAH